LDVETNDHLDPSEKSITSLSNPDNTIVEFNSSSTTATFQENEIYESRIVQFESESGLSENKLKEQKANESKQRVIEYLDENRAHSTTYIIESSNVPFQKKKIPIKVVEDQLDQIGVSLLKDFKLGFQFVADPYTLEVIGIEGLAGKLEAIFKEVLINPSTLILAYNEALALILEEVERLDIESLVLNVITSEGEAWPIMTNRRESAAVLTYRDLEGEEVAVKSNGVTTIAELGGALKFGDGDVTSAAGISSDIFGKDLSGKLINALDRSVSDRQLHDVNKEDVVGAYNSFRDFDNLSGGLLNKLYLNQDLLEQ